MPIFIASQAEVWSRNYKIEADNLAGAKEIYNNHLKGIKSLGRIVSIETPEYVEDIVDDIVWYLDGEKVELLEI